jgi:hypothetical protein
MKIWFGSETSLDCGVKKSWELFLPGVSPLSDVMREKFPGNWMRLHCLPNSKRYAENSGERNEILLRCKTLFGEIFLSSKCNLVLCFFPESIGKVRPWLSDLKLEKFEEITVGSGEAPYIVTLLGSVFNGQRPLFEEMILAVTEDSSGPLLFFDHVSGVVFAPYDGGIDLFFFQNTEYQINYFRNKYSDWLSDRADGL